jgi:hypothetical protein
MDNVQRNNSITSFLSRTASGVLQSGGQLFEQLQAMYSECAVTDGETDLPQRFLISSGMSEME